MKALVTLMLLTTFGCGSVPVPKDPPNQWILESYNADKGYIFRKDGIRYETHCSYTSIQTSTNGTLQNNDPAEAACSDILPYLHKTVPLRLEGGDLVFQDASGAKLLFRIAEAK